MKKQILGAIILVFLFTQSALATIVTLKFCNQHKRNFDKKINHRMNKGDYTPARANLLKIMAHQKCLNAEAAGEKIKDFKKIFKTVSQSYCEDLKVGMEEVLSDDIYSGDDDISSEAIGLVEDVDELCIEYSDQRASILEFQVELKNSLSIDI